MMEFGDRTGNEIVTPDDNRSSIDDLWMRGSAMADQITRIDRGEEITVFRISTRA